jgi:hypothetical protein
MYHPSIWHPLDMAAAFRSMRSSEQHLAVDQSGETFAFVFIVVVVVGRCCCCCSTRRLLGQHASQSISSAGLVSIFVATSESLGCSGCCPSTSAFLRSFPTLSLRNSLSSIIESCRHFGCRGCCCSCVGRRRKSKFENIAIVIVGVVVDLHHHRTPRPLSRPASASSRILTMRISVKSQVVKTVSPNIQV